MKLFRFSVILLFLSFLPVQIIAQEEYDVKEHYNKTEEDSPMRDGTKLHTTIYSPKDTSKEYPILMQRTPYSSRPYGEDQFRNFVYR